MFFFLRIELRSLGKISEGEELTVAYVDFLNVSEERRRMLKTQYFFDCTCEHCKNHIKDDLKMAGREVDGVKVCVCGFTVFHELIEYITLLHSPLTAFSSDWMGDKTDRKHEKQSHCDYFRQR